jgi:hypothetical protein
MIAWRDTMNPWTDRRAAPDEPMHRILELPLTEWAAALDAETSRDVAAQLELGKVVYLPRLAFSLSPSEGRFLDPRWLSGTHKSVSYEPERARETGGVRGAQGALADLEALAAMIGRFRAGALALVHAMLPAYREHLRLAPTSFRPGNVEVHKMSRRRDDTLLHVDAFASRPNRGERILRVFTNVNPSGQARVWKVGDFFDDTAREFLPRVGPPLPGSAGLLRLLRVTKSRRSRYDHIMLGIHDRMKQDTGYQARPSHLVFDFAPGSTWVCFSDQVAHAALAGQFMLEQTLHVPVQAMYAPERSPLHTLERLAGRPLT